MEGEKEREERLKDVGLVWRASGGGGHVLTVTTHVCQRLERHDPGGVRE
jgi:hypothetical protein